MEFRGQIYNSLEDWNEANNLAHLTLYGLDKYTSRGYAGTPIITNDGKYILVELKGFEAELIEAGFEFVNLDKSIIKVEVI